MADCNFVLPCLLMSIALGFLSVKFGGKKKLTKTQRTIWLLTAVIAAFVILKDFRLYEFLIGLIGAGIAGLSSPLFRNLINKDRPIFEIKDDNLLYKNHWGSIKEYPLKKFKGNVDTFKILFEEHLRTPDLTITKNSLYIGMLDKEEKKEFIDTLKEQVFKIQ